MEIVSIDSQILFKKYAKKVAECFRAVFGEDPWNEGWHCKVCYKTYGFSNEPNGLICCAEKLEECYSIQDAIGIFEKAFNQKYCHISVAIDCETVVGFNWCRVHQKSDIFSKICGTETPNLPGILDAIEKLNGGSLPKKYIIEAENGVSKNQRGQKLSDKLFKNNIQSIVASHDVEGILLSTLANSAMHHLRGRMGFKPVYHDEATEDIFLYCQLKNTPNSIF